MRLTIFLLITTIVQVSASSYGQEVTLRKKNITLEEVFKVIKIQTSYNVLWQPEKLKGARKIDADFKNAALETVLDKVLENQSLTYVIDHKTIVIRVKGKSIAEVMLDYFNSINIKGKVTDESGKPLQGATVKIKNSANVAISNINGEYELHNVEENDVLVVSFLGFKTQEVAVENRSKLNIMLITDMENLDDVVVIGYGTAKRKDLVGSIATVNADEMRKQVATNFTQGLVGRAAGVQVSRPNGNPGAGASIRIRGMSTVLGVNDPLFVIDGIPVQLYNGGGLDAQRTTPAYGLMDPLAGIDMNDIENVEILKDATATAIYGSRAANGVIIITTKKGKAGSKPVFSFNYDVSIDKQNKFYQMLSAPEYIKFMQETYLAGGSPINDKTFPGTANTDWQREVSKTGLVENWNANLIGASTDGLTNYSFSAGATDQKGIMINSGFKRYSLRTNVESKVFNLFKIGANLNYSAIQQKGGSSMLYTNFYAVKYRPDIPVFNPDGSYANDGSSDNPVASRQIKDINDGKRLLASVYAELEIIPAVKARSSISYDINNNEGYMYSPSWNLLQVMYGQKGSRSDKFFDYTNRIFDNTLTFNKSFGLHQMDAVAGASWTLNKSNYTNIESINFPDDDVLNNLGSAGAISSYTSGAESSGLESYFLRANYNYNGKYYLTISGRADNSTKFGPANQWGYFPSAGFAWRFSKESFMKKYDFIDDAKFRVTMGKTGTSAFGSFGFLTLFNTGYFYNGINGIRANPDSGQPNPNIRWESTFQTDIALELSFFKSRLSSGITYYSKYTKGMITSPSIPVSSGYTFQTKNLGDISNKGWEITLSGIPVVTKKITWKSDLNITFNKNKVEKTYGTQLYGVYKLTEGKPLNGIIGYHTSGLYQSQEEIDGLNAVARAKTGNPGAFYQNSRTKPGDVKYVDLNGDGIVNSNDREILGYSKSPKFYGGWSNTLRYKSFELSTLLQFDAGSKLLREQTPDTFFDYQSNVSREVLKGWTSQNTKTSQPRNAIDGPPQNTDNQNDRYIEDVSFLRLKNVQLSYLLDINLLRKIHISQCRIFTGMTNLLTWTKYKGLDPETDSENSVLDYGRDTGTYPQARSLTFGVNLKF